MKAIRYKRSFFGTNDHGVSEEVYKAGETYPVDDESTRNVARGIAEEVDVPDNFFAKTEEAKAEAEAPAANAEVKPAPVTKGKSK